MAYLPDIPGLTGLEQIGAGGNGVVYRARQEALRRLVAVKVLSGRLDPLAAQRFAREGQTLGAVSGHPHIVPIHQAGTTSSGEPFLVMMLCDHGSLTDAIQRAGRLSVPQVLDLGVRTAGALQTAHDAGILHRDIKPGNVLLDSYDAPRLADFGQARHVDTALTRTGDVMATPGYAAPEVLRGSPATPQSDVYALAATLMAALYGGGPFAREGDESVAAVMLRVLQEPPPDLRRIGVPDPVAAVLERAMAKDPRHRHATAAELGQALQRVQAQLGLPVTPLTVAGAPPTGVLPTVTHGQVEPILAARQVTPRVPGPERPGPAQPPAPRRGLPKKWLAAGIAAVVAIAAVIVGVSLIDTSDPRKVSDPADLLVSASSLPGSWTATPINFALVNETVGTLPTPENAEGSPSLFAICLKLPFDAIRSVSTSASYYDTAPTKPAPTDGDWNPASYRVEISFGAVMSSTTTAQQMVQRWTGATFDQCLDDAVGIGPDIGGESVLSGAQVTTDEPYDVSDVPDAMTVVVRQFTVPLVDLSSATEYSSGDSAAGNRTLTVVAAASGTSVIYVLVQSSGPALDQDQMDTLLDGLAAKLTE